MSQGSYHFEVHGRQAQSWTVQKVCDDRQSAIDSAGTLFKELSLKAVKVLEVSFGSDDPVFHDKEIFFQGEKDAPSQASDVDLIGPVCQKIEDLFLPEARQSIASLLQKPMAGWKITPLELLYHGEHLQKLNDTGQILQGAVQRVAISQIQKTGQKVNQRVLDLYSLTNELLQDLKIRGRDGNVVLLEGEDLEGLLAKAKKAENPSLVFMFGVVHFFKEIPSLDLKFEKTLELIEANDDPEILGFLDQFLADFLYSTENLHKLLGGSENLGKGLLRIIDLIRAEINGGGDGHPALLRINLLIGRNLLPETKKLLVVKVMSSLKGNASFVKGDPYKSIMFHRRILSRLNVDGNTHIGGQDSVEAIIQRCSRLTGSVSISEVLNGLEHPLDRVGRLIEVANGVVGATNLRAVANYIIPVLESPHNTQIIIENSDDDLKLLKTLSNLQQKIRDTGFQHFYHEKILSNLDRIGFELFKVKKVQNQLLSSASDKIQLGFSILGLIAEDAVPYPQVMGVVRGFAKKIIMSGDFMAELQKKALDGEADADLLKEFYMLLEGSQLGKQ
ncbi:MAG: hypothetical protein V7727_16405 [Sneathiella sp.]